MLRHVPAAGVNFREGVSALTLNLNIVLWPEIAGSLPASGARNCATR